MRITVNGVAYRVEVAGAGQPLCLLHGFTGSVSTWRPFVPVWSKELQVIRVDLIGHGATDSPADAGRYTMEHVKADLLAILDRLSVRQTHLLGYSMGGRLALTFALHHPERIQSLMLESSSPGISSPVERQERIRHDEALAQRIEREGVAAFVDYWERLPLFSSQRRLPPAMRERIRAERLQNNPRGLANSLRGMGAGAQPSWWEQLSRLAVPTLLLAGELDAKYCVIGQAAERLIPGAALRVVPDAGHAIHVEQPQIFGTMVLDYCQDRRKY